MINRNSCETFLRRAVSVLRLHTVFAFSLLVTPGGVPRGAMPHQLTAKPRNSMRPIHPNVADHFKSSKVRI